jgi:hypothetical protein
MLALVAVAALVAPVFTAATSSLLPDVLDGDRYVLGRSVFNLIGSGTQILGLGIGGAVLAIVPARWLLLAAGISLTLAAAVIRLGLRPHEAREPQAARGGRPGVIGATLSGHVRLFADPAVRGLLLAQWLPAWFVTGAESLIVPYTASLGHPASAAGPLLAAVPAGMVLGEVLIGRFCPPAQRWRSPSSRPWASRCSRSSAAPRCRWPASPCWSSASASRTSSASSRHSSTACRNSAVGRPSA